MNLFIGVSIGLWLLGFAIYVTSLEERIKALEKKLR
jgi:hypothetical protein